MSHLRYRNAAGACLAFFFAASALAQTSAVSLRGAIDREHPGTEWISTADLASRLTRPEAGHLILLDVRTPAEFAQSHLRGAIRVEPGTTDLSQLHLSGRDVVVYCSVGYRSAELMPAVGAAGARSVKNLIGGIFRWANEDRLLFDQNGRATQVHPYDAEWGRFLSDERRAPLNGPQ
jgi:rhodanese-related sulfurtransferase